MPSAYKEKSGKGDRHPMTETQIAKLDALTDLIQDILADEPTDEQIETMDHPGMLQEIYAEIHNLNALLS